MTRLHFNEKDYDTVKKYIEISGGSTEDFITDETVELGDDLEYIGRVIDFVRVAGIQHMVINV